MEKQISLDTNNSNGRKVIEVGNDTFRVSCGNNVYKMFDFQDLMNILKLINDSEDKIYSRDSIDIFFTIYAHRKNMHSNYYNCGVHIIRMIFTKLEILEPINPRKYRLLDD